MGGSLWITHTGSYGTRAISYQIHWFQMRTLEDKRSGTDEECQAEFVVSSDDEDPGDDNGDATSEHTDSE